MLSDVAMLSLGADLKRKERISARLGDVLSYLYLASATLKRYNDEGRHPEDMPLVKWAVEDSLFKIQHAMNELLNNFPNQWFGRALRVIILPFGAKLKEPSDEIAHQIAQLLQTPGAARSRLGQGQYLTKENNNLFGRLEQTLEDIILCEPIYEKVCRTLDQNLPFYQLDKVAELGLAAEAITQNEAELLIKAEKGRKWVIAVDDFDSAALVAQANNEA
jgi:acyl-CoA dehydrogenase